MVLKTLVKPQRIFKKYVPSSFYWCWLSIQARAIVNLQCFLATHTICRIRKTSLFAYTLYKIMPTRTWLIRPRH